MKAKFQLTTRNQDQNVYIDLYGIFDGASAFELVEAIEKERKQNKTLIINTSNLKKSIPFGQAILDARLSRTGIRGKIYFSGTFADQIRPEGCCLIHEKQTAPHRCQGNCKNCRCGHTGKISSVAHGKRD